MNPYIAVFNEPGDFDDFGVFLSTPLGERLILTANIFKANFDLDEVGPSDWKANDVTYVDNDPDRYACITGRQSVPLRFGSVVNERIYQLTNQGYEI